MGLTKPNRLEKGTTIAIISPSAGLAALFPHRLDNAIAFLKTQGYETREFPTTRQINGWESAPAKERASDIMAAFLSKEVRAIICSIGGSTANKTLEYLDFEQIRKNPKIFCGYSDSSVLHYALYKKAGLTTFYGPCAMTQFGEYPKPLEYTLEYFGRAVSEGIIGVVKPSESWTNELLDWGRREDLTRARRLEPNKGYEWLRSGRAKGKILGGCLHSITHLIGTEYWPDHTGAILFIDLPPGPGLEKGASLAEVDALLCDLRITAILKKVRGLIIGRPYRYSQGETKTYKKIILEATAGYSFPILYGADIGHTDPQITIPLGVEVELNSTTNNFEFLESGVG